MTLRHLVLFLHLASVIVWVGGMVFAYLCLRPAATALPPSQRLPLWVAVFQRFFPMVWGAVVLLPLTGIGRLVEVGFGHAPRAWHLMMLTGLAMIAVFLSIWFGPWRRLREAVAREEWATGAVALNQIRQRVGFNIVLGAVTVAIATLGLGI